MEFSVDRQACWNSVKFIFSFCQLGWFDRTIALYSKVLLGKTFVWSLGRPKHHPTSFKIFCIFCVFGWNIGWKLFFEKNTGLSAEGSVDRIFFWRVRALFRATEPAPKTFLLQIFSIYIRLCLYYNLFKIMNCLKKI